MCAVCGELATGVFRDSFACVWKKLAKGSCLLVCRATTLTPAQLLRRRRAQRAAATYSIDDTHSFAIAPHLAVVCRWSAGWRLRLPCLAASSIATAAASR